jgi:hypothetical protein
MRRSVLQLALMAVLLGAPVILGGAEKSGGNTTSPADANVTRRAQELTSTNAVQAAAAAYWLARHSTISASAVPRLVAVLGDNRGVDPSLYREEPRALLPKRSSPGQEAAAALVHIGQPAVDALIRALQTSTSAIARQNAAWALGQISDSAHPDSHAAVPRPTHDLFD